MDAITVTKGLQLCLRSLDDWVLDVPDAVALLAKFFARATHDKVVARTFLQSVSGEDEAAMECYVQCEELLRAAEKKE